MECAVKYLSSVANAIDADGTWLSIACLVLFSVGIAHVGSRLILGKAEAAMPYDISMPLELSDKWELSTWEDLSGKNKESFEAQVTGVSPALRPFVALDSIGSRDSVLMFGGTLPLLAMDKLTPRRHF